jgi:hypothetical protein
MDLCVYECEDHEHGVGSVVNTNLLSDTPKSIGLVESIVPRVKVSFRKKTMDL